MSTIEISLKNLTPQQAEAARQRVIKMLNNSDFPLCDVSEMEESGDYIHFDVEPIKCLDEPGMDSMEDFILDLFAGADDITTRQIYF